MSLNKGYSVHAEIKNTMAEINDNEDAFRLTKAAQKFLTIATTLIYYSFTSVIFAGVSVWAFQDYVFGNATNVNGLIFTVALVVSTPIGLALAKHSNFQAMARAPDIRVFIIRALIALAILTGVWYEAISSSSNLQEKAFHAVENSKAGANIMGTQINNTASTGYAELIAKAAQLHEQCLVKLEQAKKQNPDTKFHCNGDKSKLESLKSQANAERESVSTANVNAITAKQSALDKERDSHALPAAKAFAGWFNTSLAAGTFIIVIISSLFFELIHLSTVYSERNNLMQRNGLNRHLQNLKTEYFNLVGKTYSPEDFKDDKVLDMQELRESGAISNFKDGLPTSEKLDDNPAYKITTKGQPYHDNKTGFGFVPQTAKAFKWQNDEQPLPAKAEKPGFGFVPTRSADSLDAENRRKYLQQIMHPTGKGKTADDYALIPRVDHKRPTLQATDKDDLNGTEKAFSVDTQRGTVSTRNDKGVSFASFSELPVYPEGHCLWCGCKLEGMTKRAKFCGTPHKNFYWNLKTPANKRVAR